MYMHLKNYNGNKGLSFICHPSCIVSLYIFVSKLYFAMYAIQKRKKSYLNVMKKIFKKKFV